jgi:hypothetical protein
MGILDISRVTWAVYYDYCIETFIVYAREEMGAVFLTEGSSKLSMVLEEFFVLEEVHEDSGAETWSSFSDDTQRLPSFRILDLEWSRGEASARRLLDLLPSSRSF